MSLTEILEKRGKLHSKIIKSLSHLPIDQQLNIVLSYISIDDLEKNIKTICK